MVFNLARNSGKKLNPFPFPLIIVKYRTSTQSDGILMTHDLFSVRREIMHNYVQCTVRTYKAHVTMATTFCGSYIYTAGMFLPNNFHCCSLPHNNTCQVLTRYTKTFPESFIYEPCKDQTHFFVAVCFHALLLLLGRPRVYSSVSGGRARKRIHP